MSGPAGSPVSPLSLSSSAVSPGLILDRLRKAVTLDDTAEGRRKVAVLLSKYAIELDDPEIGGGLTPLMHAAIAGNADCCTQLLSSGASGDARAGDEFNRWSALHFAAAMGRDHCCNVLVKASTIGGGGD